MVKVDTEEQRLNPKRNKRLRKKLHVGEFKETGLDIKIDGITASEYEDECVDRFLDTVDVMAVKYGWDGGYVMFSGETHSDLYIHMNENVLNSQGGPEAFVKELIESTGYSATLEKVEDAHYPDEDDD